MALHSRILAASAIALALSVMAASAQPVHHHRRHLASRGGDVIVHTGRSYLDPGTSAEIGSEDHYFSDSIGYGAQGPDFTRNIGGFELLPTPLNPPGRQEPLAEFN